MADIPQEFVCKLCGGDVRMFLGSSRPHVSYCGDHNAVICGTCCNCNGQQVTPELVADAKTMRKFTETILQPMMREIEQELKTKHRIQ